MVEYHEITVNGDTMKKRRTLKIIILLLVILAALLYDSNTRLTVSEYEIASEKLPESFDGFTVVQLSDIHGGLNGGGNARMVQLTAEARPDIIAITGDLADAYTDMAEVEAILAELVEIAPVYYVSGNHEWAAGRVDKLQKLTGGGQGERRMDELKEVLAGCGVQYLSNSYELLEQGEESIVLAGVEDPNGPFDMIKPDELVDIIKNGQGDGFRLLLGHRNYWAEKYPELEVDIIMCGHAHGGIVRLPFVGGVLGTGFELFPEHVDGAVESGRYTMIVSRGLGNSIPVPRFLNNPEVVVLELKSE